MTEERKEQLYKAWDELSRHQLSNSENLGRAILSLSIAGLGFSLAFIKDVVSPDTVANVYLLHCSWWVFAVAIASTLLSYHTSQRGFKKSSLRKFDVVSPDTVANVYLLHCSWWVFAVAIASTLLSYHTSQRGLKKQFAQIRNELASKKNPKIECKIDRLFLITERLGYAAHGFYLVAVVLPIIFIQTNARGSIMSTMVKYRITFTLELARLGNLASGGRVFASIEI